MPKNTLEQRYSVTLKINTPVKVPWMAKKGVTLTLADDNEKIGEITVTGSHVFVRRAGKKNWETFSFRAFLDCLVS
jgi:hypothetical protein